MTRLERINRLEDATKILKTEFVGLDKIIDEIKTAITPWYITPEVLKRPVVVSLWGMTGTGKTSVVRRLMELLHLNKTIFFDCGEENNSHNSRTISDTILETLNLEESTEILDAKNKRSKLTEDLVFVFDEFQYARTINEQGAEVDKPNLRPIWNILDSGILNLVSNDWDSGYILNLIEDLDSFNKTNPNIEIENLTISNRNDVEKLVNAMGYYWYDRGLPSNLKETTVPSEKCGNIPEYMQEDESKKDRDPLRPIRVIQDRYIRTILRKVGRSSRAGGVAKFSEELANCKLLSELCKLLDEVREMMLTPRKIDCSRSLVFILGNLDEAFRVEDRISPDVDADQFFDITSNVSITDIKDALKLRFRAEQIARFGNSIIKYPTLQEKHFREIIKKESNRILKEFEETTGITVLITNNIVDLLYAEGVYPVQGVRPVFTTINSILTPLFSDIVIQSEKLHENTVKLDVKDPEAGYRVSEKTIILSIGDLVIEKSTKLILGELRNPLTRKNRYIASVHETGHAIVQTFTEGKVPNLIVSISVDGGGFCAAGERSEKILTHYNIENEVKTCLGGYEAEHLIFGDSEVDKTLMGSGVDIKTAWGIFTNAVYRTGYFLPYSFSNYVSASSNQVPFGISDEMKIQENKTVQQAIIDEFERLREETRSILKDNVELLVAISTYLAEHGEMTGNIFEEFIKKYGTGTLTYDKLLEVRKENSEDWYKEKLTNFLK